MSRIGNKPIAIPSGVQTTVKGTEITVKGPKGELSQRFNPAIAIKEEDGQLVLERPSDLRHHKAMHGLTRALLNNMVVGVTKGYEIKLELVGVGYRAEMLPNNVLDLVLGYAHHTYLQLPPEVNVEAKSDKRSNPIVTLKSTDKQLIGQVAAKIRSFRKPEPYKGKGVKFVGEVLRRKAGKAAAK